MDKFIDRLADMLKNVFRDGDSWEQRVENPRFSDPDVSEAWEELDDYLNAGRGEDARKERRSRSSRQRPAASTLNEDLRPDYATLEVPFGSDIEVVKRAYKTMILRYHPDKFAGNPDKQRIATEITQKVNQSFERIRTRLEAGRNGT